MLPITDILSVRIGSYRALATDIPYNTFEASPSLFNHSLQLPYSGPKNVMSSKLI